MLVHTTLCYLEHKDSYLMLHRTKKERDVNKDKWIGIGGHLEDGESPEDGVLREAREETGYELQGLSFRGIITFIYEDTTEYMDLFTASGFAGKAITECDEGDLEWVSKDRIFETDPAKALNLWAGDKIFFRLLEAGEPFFSLKLVYSEDGILREAALNGSPMELFDVLDADGNRTGIVQERGVCHREGDPHETVHMWVVRKDPDTGRYQVLLQKRSQTKDSNPGCYDISSAGHMAAGDDPLPSAIREIGEELGLLVSADDLEYIGRHQGNFDDVFYGIPFHDREFSNVYLVRKEIQIEDLTLQDSELESVCWMDYDACAKAVQENSIPHCIYPDEFRMVGEYLRNH